MTFNGNSLTINNKKYARDKSFLESLFNVIFVILFIIIVSYLLFCSIFDQVQVIGVSMQPTYNTQLTLEEDAKTSIYKDIVVVNKYETGKNGDIILLKTTKDMNLTEDVIIKRIIAMEGQTLTLKKDASDGYLYYHFYLNNNVKIDESYLGENYRYMDSAYFTRFSNLEGVETATDLEDSQHKLLANYIIPDGKVFVLGDNRKDSYDGSYFGAVDNTQIKGKIVFSYAYNESLIEYIWNRFISLFD